jgi:alkanesulfonate monooxygenase SsuD/methylene tetrahydromethanopterin reductase-like flavin-dependent oxidoreductase (luciferase family)
MRIGISVAQSSRLAGPAAVSAAARAAEQLGYSSIWVCDTLLDPTGVLCATAAVTTRLRLGASILLTPGCDPALLARSLATVDLLSEGRLTVALGTAPGAREDCVDEVLDALDARTSTPVVLLDGRPDRIVRRTDGWSPLGLPLEDLRSTWAALRDLAAAQGRDPDSLQLVVRAGIVLGDRPAGGHRTSYQGDADQVAEDVDATRRIGAHEIVLDLHGDLTLDDALDGYARIAEATELRAARPPAAR